MMTFYQIKVTLNTKNENNNNNNIIIIIINKVTAHNRDLVVGW